MGASDRRRHLPLGLTAAAVLVQAAAGASPVKGAAPAASPGPPQSAAALLGHPADVTVPDTRRIELVSTVNGRRYALDVALPSEPPPPAGYPVIYVLDGYAYFASVAEAARANGNDPKAVVVGIGYPQDPSWAAAVLKAHAPLPPAFANAPAFLAAASLERSLDLTPSADATTLQQASAGGVRMAAEDFGGVDGFLATLERDIKPAVRALVPVNGADQTLFGHSLGGLAVLEALFTEPAAFRNYVAASPSIWWSDRAVLRREAGFAAMVAAGKAVPRVLVTVGAEEGAPPTPPPAPAARRAAIEASLRRTRMVANACELADRLKGLHGGPGYEVIGCVVFPDQRHGVSVWPAIGRAVSFVAAP